jgi:hypothetical protein
MTSAIPAGPFETFSTDDSASAPFYLIPFDKLGRCEGPLTREHLLGAAASGEFTDIHIFSHGWNNIFKEALERYRSFFTGYLSIRAERGLNDPNNYRPLFVGIVWPSTVLVLPWEERGPSLPRRTRTAPSVTRLWQMSNSPCGNSHPICRTHRSTDSTNSLSADAR